MLKIKELYKRPSPGEHRLACLLTGACVAATASVLLIVAGAGGYAFFIVPTIMAISLIYARRTWKKRMRLESQGVVACTMVNLMVLAIFIILFR